MYVSPPIPTLAMSTQGRAGDPVSPTGSAYDDSPPTPWNGTLAGSPTGSERTGAGQSRARLAGLQVRDAGDGDAGGAAGRSIRTESTMAWSWALTSADVLAVSMAWTTTRTPSTSTIHRRHSSPGPWARYQGFQGR